MMFMLHITFRFLKYIHTPKLFIVVLIIKNTLSLPRVIYIALKGFFAT
jgi:hypothetical protein